MSMFNNVYFLNLIFQIVLCCALVGIAWILVTAHRKTLQMRYDIIIKSIDNGIKVDPEKILVGGTPTRRKLKWGIVESVIGIFFTIFGLLLCLNINVRKIRTLPDEDMEDAAIGILLFVGILLVGIVLLSFGVANIVSSAVERKQKVSE